MSVYLKTSLILAVALLWLGVCVYGLSSLAAYQQTSGAQAAAPANWPGLGLPRGQAYTLILSLHPQCPCSRATLEELSIAIAHCPKLQTDLLFIKPDGSPDDFVQSDLWKTAGKLPHCALLIDRGGKLNAAMHADTSGQACLYDPLGRLVYSGGITGGRGHSGDNAGLSSIISLVNQGGQSVSRRPVYGCPLFGPVCQKQLVN